MKNGNKLFTAIICSAFLFANYNSASAVDITSGTVNLDSDYNAAANQSPSSGALTLDAQGHSINGNGFSGIKNTNTELSDPIVIKNVGGFNLTETTKNGDNTVLKVNEQGKTVRYIIQDSGSANGFQNNAETSTYKNYGSFITTRSGLNIENSVIKNNSSNIQDKPYGGAISLYEKYGKSPNLNIVNSYITGNSINKDDTYTGYAKGGAIGSCTKGTLSIIDSYITNNTVQAQGSNYANGGAVYLEGSSIIQNTYFGNNSITGTRVQAAAINMETAASGISHQITNTIFENNTATGETNLNGGTLYLAGDLTISDSLFTNNKAVVNNGSNTSYGGVLYHFGSSADLDISNTKFLNNSFVSKEVVRQYGGTIYTNSTNATFDNVEFTNNLSKNTRTARDESYVHGGAIYMYGQRGTDNTLTIKNSKFDNNSVQGTQFVYGGAIAGENGNSSTKRYTNITNSTFTNNSATSTNQKSTGAMGGAIYNANSNILNIENSDFENNTATSAAKNAYRKTGGGAIYNESDATTTIIDTSFKKNKAVGTTDSKTSSLGGAIYNNPRSTLNVIAKNEDVVFEGNKMGADESSLVSNAIYDNQGTINLNAGTNKIVFNDKIASFNNSSVLNINKQGEWVNKETSQPATDNKIPIDAPVNGTIVLNNDMTDFTGNVNLYGGTIELGKNGTFFNPKSFTVNNVSTLNFANGVIQQHNFGNLTLNANINAYVDADLEKQTADTFNVSSINVSNDSKINITQVNVIADALAENVSIKLTENEDLYDIITMDPSVTTALGKIYKYNVDYNNENTELSFERADLIEPPKPEEPEEPTPDKPTPDEPTPEEPTADKPKPEKPNLPTEPTVPVAPSKPGSSSSPQYKDLNPAIVSGQVAALAGGYLTQLNSYNMAFNNMDMYMLKSREERQAIKNANKYASVQPGVYSPTMTPYDEKGIWFKPYTTFENVKLDNGPKVSNVSYGSYFGADSDIIELGDDVDATFSVYAGYNGSHQAYDGNSIYQNGGQVGATGILYKGNFFSALTANVGANVGEANTMFGNDNFTMLMTGVAAKLGYNWETADSRFVIQPNWQMSYSFVNTFDYKTASGVQINTDPLNALQLSPGLKFIYNSKNGWQPYASLSMVWNIMNDTKFKANDVMLPNMSIDPYFAYGLGIQKNTGERGTGFFQTMVHSGGRNGVGLQFGFRYAI